MLQVRPLAVPREEPQARPALQQPEQGLAQRPRLAAQQRLAQEQEKLARLQQQPEQPELPQREQESQREAWRARLQPALAE